MYSSLGNLNLKFSLIIILISLSSACISQVKSDSGLGSFDTTPDGKYLVFTWRSQGSTKLYRSDIDGKNPKILIDSIDNYTIYNPRCSNDSKYITIACGSSKSRNGAIWMVGIDGDNLTQVTDSGAVRPLGIISPDNKMIYFLESFAYGASSPIGRAAAHGTDVYAVNIKDRNGVYSKITNYNAYSMGNMSFLDSTRLLLSIYDGSDGLIIYDMVNKKSDRIMIPNDSLGYSKRYSDPAVVDEHTIICSSAYLLMVVDIRRHEQKVILGFDGLQFKDIRHNKSKKKIFFTKGGIPNMIYTMNINGSDLRPFKIDLPFQEE